jgi:gluconokinase
VGFESESNSRIHIAPLFFVSAVTLTAARPPFVLVIDIGTSSLRAMLYDANAHEIENCITRVKYHPATTDDGGSTLDANEMFHAFTGAVNELLERLPGEVEIRAVAASSLAGNVLAVDADGQPLTPVYLYADTQNARSVERLRAAYDWGPIYARTGCPLHTAYLPARMLWLRETQPGVFQQAARFVSLHEFFLLQLFGRAGVSHSFAAWTGMLNHDTDDWDDQVLQIAGISREQLSPLVSASHACSGLEQEFARRWQVLADIPWYPALGDGAVANVGSGCVDETRVAVTVGTSGAMRVVLPAKKGILALPRGLWMYRVDETDGLVGGSLTDGGSIFSYYSRLLNLPAADPLTRELEAMQPDAHGLTMLPFFGGERSPGYHGDARATLTGWNLNTSPAELWRAALEALAYRFAAIYDLILHVIPMPQQVIASGGVLLNSPVGIQILADVLQTPVIVSGEDEASARGAALVALRSAGIIHSLHELDAALGETCAPNPAHFEIYKQARERQKTLYDLILER